jgi:hypothetical protein
MPLVLTDLVPRFLEFWDAADGRPRDEQRSLWTEYVAANPLVVDDVARFGATGFDPDAVLDAYPQLLPRIRDNAGRIEPWLRHAADDVTGAVGEPELPLRCVSLVGLNRSFGWVSVHDEEAWLFLPIELIGDDVEAGIVARHEMGHLAQIGLGGREWLHDERLGLLLYSEGYAPLLTAEIWPDVPMSQHIAMFAGQQEWYADALAAVPEATRRLAGLLEVDDPATLAQYFAVGAESDLPERIGYLVGVRVLQRLRAEHSWRDLAGFGVERAMAETRRVLAELVAADA